MDGFTEEQQGHARLAQALREMAPYATDIHLGMARGPDGQSISAIWPASNIREALMDAAELIDRLLIEGGAR